MPIRLSPAGALSVLLLAACSTKPDPRGAALFYGREPMVGRILADPAPLPPLATKCVNCHEQDNVSPLTGQGGASYAPRLDRAGLTAAVTRRGGPPSRYDEPAFCRVLRDGVDPAHIIVSTIMPRYELGDDACQTLWRFVNSR